MPKRNRKQKNSKRLVPLVTGSRLVCVNRKIKKRSANLQFCLNRFAIHGGHGPAGESFAATRALCPPHKLNDWSSASAEPTLDLPQELACDFLV